MTMISWQFSGDYRALTETSSRPQEKNTVTVYERIKPERDMR